MRMPHVLSTISPPPLPLAFLLTTPQLPLMLPSLLWSCLPSLLHEVSSPYANMCLLFFQLSTWQNQNMYLLPYPPKSFLFSHEGGVRISYVRNTNKQVLVMDS